MDKKEVAAVLEEIANLLEMKGENPFKVRAFSNGVRIIENLSQDLSDLVTAHSLKKVKGIGEGLAQVITELVQKGQSTYHLKLRSSVPELEVKRPIAARLCIFGTLIFKVFNTAFKFAVCIFQSPEIVGLVFIDCTERFPAKVN